MAALQKPFKERRSYGKDVSIVFLALVNHNLFKTLLLIRNKENEDIAYNASVLEKFCCALGDLDDSALVILELFVYF